jgi:lipopolysaccharide/colanic/teichoic acid biosynthesis glycosyltransferase
LSKICLTFNPLSVLYLRLATAGTLKLTLIIPGNIVATLRRRADIMERGWPRDLETLPGRVERAVDICFAVALLVFVLPLMVSIAILVKLESPGPVLSKQRQLGLDDRPFDLYRFRSTHDPARLDPARLDPALPQARRNDPRVTRIGRFLRHTSLDELPQFINVLKGETSLVAGGLARIR